MNQYLKIAIVAAAVAGTAAVAAGVDDSNWQPGPSEAWFVNWDKALAEARKSGKALFLLNTGSDWCGWCKRLKADVLDTPEFAEFAREKLVFPNFICWNLYDGICRWGFWEVIWS